MKQAIFFPGSMRTVIAELLTHTLKVFSHRTVCKDFPGPKPCAQLLECFWDSLEVRKSQKQQQLTTHSTCSWLLLSAESGTILRVVALVLLARGFYCLSQVGWFPTWQPDLPTTAAGVWGPHQQGAHDLCHRWGGPSAVPVAL